MADYAALKIDDGRLAQFMIMKNILIICYSHLHRDPRVLRQIQALSPDYNIYTLGLSSPNVSGVKHTDISMPQGSRVRRYFLLASRQFENLYWETYGLEKNLKTFQDNSFHAIIANDIQALPFAARIKNRSKLIYDAHEFSPRQSDELLFWRLFLKPFTIYLCRAYLKTADTMLTVSPGIASAYARDFGVMPLILTNAADYCDLSPSPTSPQSIRLVHHGSAMPSRRLENLIRAMVFLDSRYSLDLILVVPPGSKNYYDKLQEMAASDGRISFPEPVAFNKIVPTLHNYDVGIYSLPPKNFNSAYALPNKLFEFIQARLAIAIGPSPEMANLVRKYNLGEVAGDFSPRSLADAILRMNISNISCFKMNSHTAAAQLSAEKNLQLLREIVSE